MVLVRGAWASGDDYAYGNLVQNRDRWWFCYVPHTAASANEPGVGASYSSCWYPWGLPGDEAYLYIGYASDDSGSDFSTSPSSSLHYVAFLSTDELISSPQANDFVGLWVLYKGDAGGLMNFIGAWSDATTYALGDGILSSEGRTFISLQDDNLNHAPPSYPGTNNAYWYLVAERGSDGADGELSWSDAGAASGKLIQRPGDYQVGADEVVEISPGAGVTLEQILLKDGYIDLPQISSPGAPGSGKTRIFSKNDGKGYRHAYGGDETELGAGGGTAFWSDVEGTPTRVSDTQFTLTDAGNAHKYDLLLKKRVLLSWLDSGSYKSAMVISSSYSSDTVTVNIVGDALAAGFTDMRYAIMLCPWVRWIVPGYLGTGTDVAVTHTAECGMIPLAVDGKVKAAGTTGALTVDINDDGSSIMNGPTNDFSISSGNTETLNTQVYTRTEIAADSDITIDIDGTCTTPAKTLYLKLYWYPASWRYRT